LALICEAPDGALDLADGSLVEGKGSLARLGGSCECREVFELERGIASLRLGPDAVNVGATV
jgi:hypothetical protein